MNEYSQPRPLQQGESKTMTVWAAEPWNTSGILCEKGVAYSFHVESIDEPWIDGTVPADPGAGWVNWKRFLFFPFRFLARYPASNWYTLIGTIGEEREHFFYIGKSARMTATATGEFMCFANDMESKYGNNYGRLTLRVCRD